MKRLKKQVLDIAELLEHRFYDEKKITNEIEKLLIYLRRVGSLSGKHWGDEDYADRKYVKSLFKITDFLFQYAPTLFSIDFLEEMHIKLERLKIKALSTTKCIDFFSYINLKSDPLKLKGLFEQAAMIRFTYGVLYSGSNSDDIQRISLSFAKGYLADSQGQVEILNEKFYRKMAELYDAYAIRSSIPSLSRSLKEHAKRCGRKGWLSSVKNFMTGSVDYLLGEHSEVNHEQHVDELTNYEEDIHTRNDFFLLLRALSSSIVDVEYTLIVAGNLSNRPLSVNQFLLLLNRVKDKAINERARSCIAENLSVGSDLSNVKFNLLVNCVEEGELDDSVVGVILQTLANREDLSFEQFKTLFWLLKGKRLVDSLCAHTIKILSQRASLNVEQFRMLFDLLSCKRLDNPEYDILMRVGVAEALVSRNDLKNEQIECILGLLRQESLEKNIKKVICKKIISRKDLKEKQPQAIREALTVLEKLYEPPALLASAIKAYYKEEKGSIQRLFECKAVSIDEYYQELVLLLKKEGAIRNSAHQKYDVGSRLAEDAKPIALDNIFQPSKEGKYQINRLLLLGRAGVGKTTVLQKMAYAWAKEGDNFGAKETFDLVLLLPLPALKEEPNASLAKMVQWHCLSIIDRKRFKVEEIENILYPGPGLPRTKFLLLLDGYDKLDVTFLESRLWQECLKAPCWLVSSRSVAPGEALYDKAERYIENVGFNKKQLEFYIKTYFSPPQSPGAGFSLIKLLDRQPILAESLRTPIVAQLFCRVWDKQQVAQTLLTAPPSLSKLYHPVLIDLFRCYLIRQYSDLDAGNWTEKAVLEDRRVAPYFEFLQLLARLACESSINTIKQYFPINLEQKEIADWFKEKKIERQAQLDFIKVLSKDLGLLVCHGNSPLIRENTYSFVHLSLQEFIYATWFAKSISKNTYSLKQVTEKRYAPDWRLIWRFVAGNLSCNKEGLTTFFSALNTWPRDVIGVRHLSVLAECLDECASQDPVLNYFIEQQMAYLHAWIPYLDYRHSWLQTLARCPHLLSQATVQKHLLDFMGMGIKQTAVIKSEDGKERLLALLFQAATLQYRTFDVLIKALRGKRDLSNNFLEKIGYNLVRHANLIDSQKAELFSLLEKNNLNTIVYGYIARGLAQCLNLTNGQWTALFSLLRKDSLDVHVRSEMAHSLAIHPSLTDGQEAELFSLLKEDNLNGGIRGHVAWCLAQRPSLTGSQWAALCATLKDDNLDYNSRCYVAQSLTKRESLTENQWKQLLLLLENNSLDVNIGSEVAGGLAKRQSLTESQWKQLFLLLKNNSLDVNVRSEVARGLAEHPSLMDSQWEQLFSLLKDDKLDSYLRSTVSYNLARRSSLTGSQWNQLL